MNKPNILFIVVQNKPSGRSQQPPQWENKKEIVFSYETTAGAQI